MFYNRKDYFDGLDEHINRKIIKHLGIAFNVAEYFMQTLGLTEDISFKQQMLEGQVL